MSVLDGEARGEEVGRERAALLFLYGFLTVGLPGVNPSLLIWGAASWQGEASKSPDAVARERRRREEDGEVGILGGGRAERTTAWVLVTLGIIAAVAGIVFNLYNRFHWYDEVIHTYNFFALTLLIAVYAYGAVLTGGREHGFLMVLAVTVFGLGLGALWEIAEFLYDHFIVKPNAILPKRDTIIDMALDTLGALVAGLVRLWMLRR